MDYFPLMEMKPNPSCSDRFCCERQEKWKEAMKDKPSQISVASVDEVVHEDNQWGMFCSLTFQLDVYCSLSFQLGMFCSLSFQLGMFCSLSFQLGMFCSLSFQLGMYCFLFLFFYIML